MADSKQQQEWAHSSWLGHIVLCAAPFRKHPAPSPADLNPLNKLYGKKPDIVVPFSDIISAFSGVRIPRKAT